MSIAIIQYYEIVAASIECRFHDLEMDRGQLGAQDGIIFPHFFREGNFVNGRGADRPLHMPHLPHPEGGEQRTDPDLCGPQVVDLIDL